MFDRVKRNGLTARLLRRAGLPNNEAAIYLVAPIAMANYPKRAELPFLPPKIGQRNIWHVTQRYVDHGVGDLNDLYQAIWGMSFDQYNDQLFAYLDRS